LPHRRNQPRAFRLPEAETELVAVSHEYSAMKFALSLAVHQHVYGVDAGDDSFGRLEWPFGNNCPARCFYFLGKVVLFLFFIPRDLAAFALIN
jgi:NADH:ubiquinone oxidoreductase subunit H